MEPETRSKMKQAITEYIETDATDFEVIWVYHRIFHERLSLTKNLPKCEKCETLQKEK